MGILSLLLLGFTHPSELRSMIHYKIWRDPLNDIKENPKQSGWDRQMMRDCWAFLDLTSRSFAAVIKELKGELSRVICLFYLVLRALDTVEDDMTIPAEKKIPLLVNFYKKLEEPGWNFKESGPDEKDRQLLVEFDKVIAEYQLLAPGYRTVISDITAKMGAGMASYIEASSKSPLSMTRWADYDLYCHFVAGLVGEGLSRLFSESEIERPWLGDQLSLSNHMGLFLQKTNIIRDYAEDCEEGRFFWPKECWASKLAGFSSQKEVADGIVETSPGSQKFRPEGEKGQRSMYVLSSMLLDAIAHSTHALDYLALLKDQSVFNFCAIPQVMAIATIDLMVNNPDVFKKNVKIRKGQAVQLIIKAVNPRDVAYTFLGYARSIHKKLSPSDPNFVRWAVELGRIESWCETYYPSFVQPGNTNKAEDARSSGLKKWASDRRYQAIVKAEAAKKGQDASSSTTTSAIHPRDLMTSEEKSVQEKKERDEMIFFFIVIIGTVTIAMGTVALGIWFAAWYMTQEGQDPLSLSIQNAYYFVKNNGTTYAVDVYVEVKEAFGQVIGNLRNKVEL
ncbi:putative farnesyl-diphosphate farnesyltransferase [Violaceomyces palustris]|uniref:Farnesyl-diphosphate farnesyltransferase n=1 Tax=Violaceomyces palustris TaxID=1673888 RepID=A0ACD0NXU5_9BASI|nr:putative farnesyl-diphosphate farnesyltransferase [Violaceomyces palustris]